MAITRAQQFKQMLAQGGRIGLRGGGADMGKERGPETGREPGPVGGGKGIGGNGGNTNRERGIMRSIPQAVTDIQRGTLSDPREKQDVFERPSKLSFLDFVPGIGTVRRIARTFGPLDNKKFFEDKVVPSLLDRGMKVPTFENYMKLRMSNQTDAYGNPIDQDDDDNNIMLPQTMFARQTPSITKEEEEKDNFNFRLLADGGRIGAQEGGIISAASYADGGNVVGGEFDFESARQMYGLGKLVKKVTRTVKKIAKSPIGKAALAFGAYKLGGMGFGKSNLSLFERFGNLTALQKAGVVGSGILTAAPFFMKPEEDDEEVYSGADIADPRFIMANPQKFQNIRTMAEGGSTEKEPVAKKTMPLLDMGGQEMDLRAEGGFVPIGRMEKADDVPARLSKNEFVFTADAVRNAGDGDVDKGAEVMYNMMKNLEAGGEVSEESQGLEGARKMFQTSQRLGEVL